MADYRGVLFDLDGTLIDSYGAIAASVNAVRKRYGLSPLSEPEVRRLVGRGPEYLMRHTVPGCDPSAALDHYCEHHTSVMIELTRLLPGAENIVRYLHQRGVRIGVCSNKPREFSKAILEHFGLNELFSLILGPEDVPRPKPAPDMLLEAIEGLALPAEDILYVGDMSVDIETARAAGVAVWVVATGSESREQLVAARPDALFDSLDSLAGALRDGKV